MNKSMYAKPLTFYAFIIFNPNLPDPFIYFLNLYLTLIYPDPFSGCLLFSVNLESICMYIKTIPPSVTYQVKWLHSDYHCDNVVTVLQSSITTEQWLHL